jgi:PKD domain/Secretion system C-terminal sorting domain
MKKLLLTITVVLFAFSINTYGQACPGGLLSNESFTSGLTNWSQYGTVTTATVLPVTSGCINNALAMQATNNSNCGVSQLVTIKQDSCYRLCYCVEFPFIGALFNSKLTIAAITPGITVTQLLSGSFTATQAQIIDVVTATNGIVAFNQCPPQFTATGNFTSIVIVNETIGNLGTDVRVDDVCLQRAQCSSSCLTANLIPGFTYTQGPGLQVNFINTSTVAAGYSMTYSWDFGDPPSGPLNTSTLQNPTHLYPAPAIYFVCLAVDAIDPNGLTACQDTFCIDVIVQPTGVAEIPLESLIKITPNPATDVVTIKSLMPVTSIQLFNSVGQMVHAENLQGNTFVLPANLPIGIYSLVLNTSKGQAYKKLLISR